MSDKVIVRFPKWYLAAVAVPTAAALFLGGALMSKKPFDPDPLGSHSIDPTPVFESLGALPSARQTRTADRG